MAKREKNDKNITLFCFLKYFAVSCNIIRNYFSDIQKLFKHKKPKL